MGKRDWAARSVAVPEPGYFAMRLVRGGPTVAARIVHSEGLWNAVVDGLAYRPASDPAAAEMVFRIWHGAEQITEAGYFLMLRQKADAIAANRNDPAAHPTKKIDLANLPSIF